MGPGTGARRGHQGRPWAAGGGPPRRLGGGSREAGPGPPCSAHPRCLRTSCCALCGSREHPAGPQPHLPPRRPTWGAPTGPLSAPGPARPQGLLRGNRTRVPPLVALQVSGRRPGLGAVTRVGGRCLAYVSASPPCRWGARGASGANAGCRRHMPGHPPPSLHGFASMGPAWGWKPQVGAQGGGSRWAPGEWQVRGTEAAGGCQVDAPGQRQQVGSRWAAGARHEAQGQVKAGGGRVALTLRPRSPGPSRSVQGARVPASLPWVTVGRAKGSAFPRGPSPSAGGQAREPPQGLPCDRCNRCNRCPPCGSHCPLSRLCPSTKPRPLLVPRSLQRNRVPTFSAEHRWGSLEKRELGVSRDPGLNGCCPWSASVGRGLERRVEPPSCGLTDLLWVVPQPRGAPPLLPSPCLCGCRPPAGLHHLPWALPPAPGTAGLTRPGLDLRTPLCAAALPRALHLAFLPPEPLPPPDSVVSTLQAASLRHPAGPQPTSVAGSVLVPRAVPKRPPTRPPLQGPRHKAAAQTPAAEDSVSGARRSEGRQPQGKCSIHPLAWMSGCHLKGPHLVPDQPLPLRTPDAVASAPGHLGPAPPGLPDTPPAACRSIHRTLPAPPTASPLGRRPPPRRPPGLRTPGYLPLLTPATPGLPFFRALLAPQQGSTRLGDVKLEEQLGSPGWFPLSL